MMISISRPDPTEYAPFYGTYVGELADDSSLPDLLAVQGEEARGLLASIPEDGAGFRYAPGKWSVKEVTGHLVDAERVFIYRAACFARGDAGPLPGFDENEYVAAANFDRRTLADLAAELGHVRAASLAFFRGLNEEELARRGVANECEFSVRALAWIVAGHERHHLDVLKERYLGTT